MSESKNTLMRILSLKKRFEDIGITLLDQALVSGVNFITAFLVARFIGLSSFGVFSIAWMIVLFHHSFQLAFIIMPMQILAPQHKGNERKHYYMFLLILQVLTALLAAGSAGAITYFGGEYIGLSADVRTQLWLPVLLTVLCTQLAEFVRRAAITFGAAKSSFFIDSIRYTLQLVALAGFYAAGYGSASQTLITMALCAGFSFMVGALFLTEVIRWGAVPFSLVRRHGKLSIWLVPTVFLQWTSGNVFFVATGAILGPLEMGALKSAQNLLGVTHVFFEGLNNWAPARAAKLYLEKGKRHLKRFVAKIGLLMVAGTLAIALTIALPAELWLETIYGSDFKPYGWLVRGLCVVYLLMAAVAPLRYSVMATESTKPIFLGYLVSTAFALSSAQFLISNYGLRGVLVGFGGAQVCLLLVMGIRNFHFFQFEQSEKSKIGQVR